MKTLILLLTSLSFVFAQPEPAVITVSPTVLRSAAEMEPLGVNNFGDIGGTKHAAGNLLFDSGFEPIRIRILHRVIEVGEDRGHPWVRLDGAGTSNWLFFTDGTFSGATLRGFRFTNAAGETPLRKDRQGNPLLDEAAVDRCTALPDMQVLPIGTAGFPQGGWLAPAPKTFKEFQDLSNEAKEELRKQWRLYYQGGERLRIDDVVIVEREFFWPEVSEFHPRTSEQGIRTNWEIKGAGSIRHLAHAGPLPSGMDGGRGHLELIPENGRAVIWNKIAGGTARKDANWYGTLDEGTVYRYEAWVRGEGKLTLTFGEIDAKRATSGYFSKPIAQSFTLTPNWTRVGFEFTAPAPGAEGIWGATLLLEGNRPAHIDNVKLQPVYQPGDADKPFVVHRPLFQTLMDSQPATGRKGALRIWFGLNSASMASLLDWYPENKIGFGTSMHIQAATEYTLPKALTILEATGDSPQTRMVPWLITQVTHSAAEYRQLVEYLAAPYDATKDTPASKPMAYKRYTQRGHGRPWTADFREILLEFGNENWHNRAMADWIGMGRSGTVHQSGRVMGLWAALMTDEMRKSPYWDGGKIKINFGGNYSSGVNADGSVTGYGQEGSVAAAGRVDYHSHATYIGPRWEVGEKSQTSIDDAGVQKTLLSHRGGNEAEWESQSKAHEAMKKLGLNIRMSAYEGGPSGFGLRAKTPEEDRAGEYYGKSMAMGTAMFDAWMNAWRLGWTHQCYLNFGQGRWWSSHTGRTQGYRPSPGFQAMTLINRTVANLDMVTAGVKGAPSVSVKMGGSRGVAAETLDIPLLQAHAFAGAGKVAVAFANLQLNKAQPVVIVAPIRDVKRISIHYLDGNPRDTNLDELKVRVQRRELDARLMENGVMRTSIPAGTAGVLLFE